MRDIGMATAKPQKPPGECAMRFQGAIGTRTVRLWEAFVNRYPSRKAEPDSPERHSARVEQMGKN